MADHVDHIRASHLRECLRGECDAVTSELVAARLQQLECSCCRRRLDDDMQRVVDVT